MEELKENMPTGKALKREVTDVSVLARNIVIAV